MRNPAPPPCITGWPPQKRSVFSQTLWASDVPPGYNVHNWCFLCSFLKNFSPRFSQRNFSLRLLPNSLPGSLVTEPPTCVQRSSGRSNCRGEERPKKVSRPGLTSGKRRKCLPALVYTYYAVRTCTPSRDLAGMSLINLEKRTRDI